MKKWISVLLAAILAATFLAGCGAASKGNAENGLLAGSGFDGTKDEGIYETGSGSSISDSTNTVLSKNQKMVRKIWLEAETEDLDTLLSNVEQQIAALSGYVESQDQHNGSNYSGSRRYRNASLTIRIPADGLDSFVTQVSAETNIVSKKQTAENITLSYTATQSHVTALETEQTRLLELLAKAETMSDILDIEERLTKVRTDLEKYTSQMRVYDNMVDYGTVYLQIREVTEYTVVEEPDTVWERIGTGFMESLENLGDFFVEFFIFVVCALPYLALLGILAAGVILMVKCKRKKKANTPPEKDA